MTKKTLPPADRKKLHTQIAATQKKADAAKKAAKLAKLVLRQAKKKSKDAKRAAKTLRKELKALKSELAALRDQARGRMPADRKAKSIHSGHRTKPSPVMTAETVPTSLESAQPAQSLL